MELRNRLVVPAMETGLSADGLIGERVLNYWKERAKGGWGLLTVEVAAITPVGKGFAHSLTIYDEESIPGYRIPLCLSDTQFFSPAFANTSSERILDNAYMSNAAGLCGSSADPQ